MNQTFHFYDANYFVIVDYRYNNTMDKVSRSIKPFKSYADAYPFYEEECLKQARRFTTSDGFATITLISAYSEGLIDYQFKIGTNTERSLRGKRKASTHFKQEDLVETWYEPETEAEAV